MLLLCRSAEMVDFVSEPQPIYPNRVEEDPALFSSQRTGRGPLSANWLDDVWRNHQKRTLSGECHSLHNGINGKNNIIYVTSKNVYLVYIAIM